MGMGICCKENVNEEAAALPVISSASPGERILPELDDINVKPTDERILPESNNINTIENNIITMKLNIEKKDVNKPTKILYNIDRIIRDCDLKELNESNTELFINGKQCKYKSYFIPEEKGVYEIKLIIKILMKNCCCLFFGLSNLQSIDLSLFKTQNVTNMSYMFYSCKNLNSINLSSFNTQKVTNMYAMFYNCYSLKNLDLFSFNTKNIRGKGIGFIFSGCRLERVVLGSDATNLSEQVYEGLGSYFKKDTIVYA